MGMALVERDDELHVVADGPEARLYQAMGLLNVATAEVVASIAAALAGGATTPDGLRFTDGSGRLLRGPSPCPPNAPPHEEAAAMGLPASTWEPPHGERLDTWWITWS